MKFKFLTGFEFDFVKLKLKYSVYSPIWHIAWSFLGDEESNQKLFHTIYRARICFLHNIKTCGHCAFTCYNKSCF